jgi:hypothetical protein
MYRKTGNAKRRGLIGKLVEPYPRPIRKKQERHYLARIVPLLPL